MDIIETTLLNKRVRLLQPRDGFHASIDTVFLAAAVPAKPGDNLLDMGCGVGSAGLCVMERVSGCTLTGIDFQKPLVEIARKNAALNGIEDKAAFICSDFRNDTVLPERAFHCVMMNPPYMEEGKHTPSPNASKAMANGGEAALEDWLRYAFARLIKGGNLAIIHRADRLDDILAALRVDDFGAASIYPLWPKAGSDAKRVIVSARKHKKSPLVFHPGMILHEQDGKYTKAADGILLDKGSISG